MVFQEPDVPESYIEQVQMLQNMAVSVAENRSLHGPSYASIRANLRANQTLWNLAPPFIRTCRDEQQVRSHLRGVAHGSGSWAIRRDHIYEAFRPLLDHLEGAHRTPLDASASEVLSSFDAEGVHRAWERALERRLADPEGAVTAARTLVETVCKRILEEAGVPYREADDLPQLYRSTSQTLQLAPSQHSEVAFRSILGGCHTVVQGLGTLRNRIGDAHGQGRHAVRPAPRHAALAVNLAGAMATYLVETWLARSV